MWETPRGISETPMSTPYIPPRDVDLDDFLENFSTLIAASPAKYGLTSGEAAEISASVAAWHAAYLLTTSPGTRTSVTINEKDVQRKLTIELVRRFAAAIRIDPAVDDALLIGLGLTPRSTSRSRISAPTSLPVLSFTGMDVGRHTLDIRPEKGSLRIAKPAGTIGLLVFRATGDEPLASTIPPRGAEFIGFITRPRFESAFEHADNGKIATYFARWTNAKGELGPWGMPVSMRVAA